MSGLYLDTSAVIPTLVSEPGSKAVEGFLSSQTLGLLISEFTAAEVASAVSRLVRIGLFEPAQGRETLADFDLWRDANAQLVDVQSADVRAAGMIVRRFELMLRAPDALHVAIARRQGATLITMDRRLARAASDLGVDVALVSAQA